MPPERPRGDRGTPPRGPARRDRRRPAPPPLRPRVAEPPAPPLSPLFLVVAAIAAACVVFSVTFRIVDSDMWQHLLVGKAIWQLGSVIVPAVVGVVYQQTNSMYAAFVALAIGPLLASVMMFSVRERHLF